MGKVSPIYIERLEKEMLNKENDTLIADPMIPQTWKISLMTTDQKGNAVFVFEDENGNEDSDKVLLLGDTIQVVQSSISRMASSLNSFV